MTDVEDAAPPSRKGRPLARAEQTTHPRNKPVRTRRERWFCRMACAKVRAPIPLDFGFLGSVRGGPIVVQLTVQLVPQLSLRESLWLLRAPQVEVSHHWLVSGLHVGPVLGVMVGIDHSKHGVVHVPVLGAASNIDEVKFYRLTVRRELARHARTVASVTVMRQGQTV